MSESEREEEIGKEKGSRQHMGIERGREIERGQSRWGVGKKGRGRQRREKGKKRKEKNGGCGREWEDRECESERKRRRKREMGER